MFDIGVIDVVGVMEDNGRSVVEKSGW